MQDYNYPEAPDTDTPQPDIKKQAEEKSGKRTSSIQWDYDPTPKYDIRQPDNFVPSVPKLHIDNLHPMDFSGSILTNDKSIIQSMTVKERKQRFLAGKCMQLRNASSLPYMVRGANGLWFRTHKKGAQCQLSQDWEGDKTRFNITDKSIDDFFISNTMINIEGTMDAPGHPEHIEFDDKPFINSFIDTRLGYDPEYDIVEDKCFQHLIKMLSVNLLDIPDYTFEKTMLEILGNDKDSIIRWFFMWFANIYQNPGVSMASTLWVVGPAQGIGKNLLGSNIMTPILGEQRVDIINEAALTGNFNEFIDGKFLLIGDDVNFASKTEFYKTLKRYVGSEKIAINKKFADIKTIPNVTNWLFTSNDRKLINIDEKDRRNTFIETNSDQEQGQKLTISFFEDFTREERKTAFRCLASLFSVVNVNYKFINFNCKTPLWRELVSYGMNPVLRFLSQSDKIKIGKPEHLTKLYDWYTSWAITVNHRNENQINMHYFAERIKDIVAAKRYMESPTNWTMKNGHRARSYILIERPETELMHIDAPHIVDSADHGEESDDYKEMQSKNRLMRLGKLSGKKKGSFYIDEHIF